MVLRILLDLISDEHTFNSVYIQASKLSLILLIASAFSILQLWLPTPVFNPAPLVASPWKHVGKNMKTLGKFIWPQTLSLQFRIHLCLGILVIGRVVNVLVPVQYKVVIDALTSNDAIDKRPFIAYGAILIFVSLRFLQGL